MKKLTISVFLILFQSVLMFDPPQRYLKLNSTHANCYESYKFKFGSRNRPSATSVLPIDDEKDNFRHISLARHHIIPYNILRDFYNRLVTNEEHFRYLIDNVLVVAGFNAGVDLRTNPHLNSLRYTRLGELPVMLRNHIENNLSQNRQLNLARELYTWMTFNIFIGPDPESRNDDPGENFEDNAHVIIGQLRLNQLRRMQADMIAYIQGRNTNPIDLLSEMGDLLRINPEPYSFNYRHWRQNRSLRRPYAIATEAIQANPQYTYVQDIDFCPIGEFAFLQYLPPDFSRRSRRLAQEKKPCLIRDEGAKHDRYCINSLNVLSELIKENIVTLNDDIISINVAEPNGTEQNSPKSDCRPILSAVGGAVTGAASAFAACLLAGGAYIPLFGWAGCGAGSAIYGAGGAFVGSSLSLAQC